MPDLNKVPYEFPTQIEYDRIYSEVGFAGSPVETTRYRLKEPVMVKKGQRLHVIPTGTPGIVHGIALDEDVPRQFVHFMHHGVTACGISDLPSTWPDNHRWDSDWDLITCPACLAFKLIPPTYEILEEGRAFKCLRCGRISYHPEDVKNHWCDCCKTFHDDLLPTCRAWWITTWDDHREQELAMSLVRNELIHALESGVHPSLIRSCVERILDAYRPDLDKHVKKIQTKIKK